ncbi:MAG: hypothetical protein C5B45_00315 [Chlamydiae bacterium]|nr:MAG: hypothetical protein C5B45_00315 [Chlamydiota bacterium]
MIHPLDAQSVVIDIPQTQQEEGLAQQNSIWNKITAIPISQKGLLLSLGIYSTCTAIAAIAKFFEPDPPPDSLLPSFVDSTVVEKNAQKWTLGLVSLTTMAAITLYARYFLQKNQQQAENPITPEIASIIKSYVEEEMIKATPGPNGLQNIN